MSSFTARTDHLRPVDPHALLRVAVVGSGPSGAYAAEQLLSYPGAEIHVDVYERLPTPWGLVRAGVAPDHPKIKSVTRVYEKTAAHPRFTYFGNVAVGTHLTRAELLARYSAVIYAVGTPSARSLAIPGEDLPGSSPATDFVGWYNGHPDQRDLVFDLSCRRVVVIGNGNVALDVARMLSLTSAELRATDMADHAIEAFEASAVEEIVVVGRRGPEQAAFTNPELRELGELSDADVIVDPLDLDLPDAVREREPGPTAKRNLEVLTDYASRPASGKSRRICLRFLQSPTRLLGDGRVEALELVRNDLVRTPDGRLAARAGDDAVTVETGLVLGAIGYRGAPLDDVPFDADRGIIRNVDGRVVDNDGRWRGEYVVGWAKRGPSGVIGTNKKCALGTVRALCEDLEDGRLTAPSGAGDADSIRAFLAARQPRLVDYGDWQAIDLHEQDLGRAQERPRVKLTGVEEMLDVAERSRRRPLSA